MCGDSKFPIHRILLSRCSEKFRAIFRVENEGSQFNIADVDSETLSLMLEYIYRAQIPTEKVTMKILLAADNYGIESLVNFCETQLIRHIDCDNVVDTLVSVHGTAAKNLFREASLYFLQNHSYLKESGSFSGFEDAKPELIWDIVELERSDDLVSAAILRERKAAA